MLSVVARLALLLHYVADAMDTTSSFLPRHIGPSAADQSEMLEAVGHGTLDQLGLFGSDVMRFRDVF